MAKFGSGENTCWNMEKLNLWRGGCVVRAENADEECGKIERMHLSPAKKGRKKSAGNEA